MAAVSGLLQMAPLSTWPRGIRSVMDYTGDISRKRLHESAMRGPISGLPHSAQPATILGYNSPNMEPELPVNFPVQPSAQAPTQEEATEEMGEDNFTKFMNQAFMAAMLKRKDVPFPGGRIAGSVKTAPGPEPMRRSWEKDYRTL